MCFKQLKFIKMKEKTLLAERFFLKNRKGKIIVLSTKSNEEYNNRMIEKYNLLKYEEAMKVFDRAIEENPQDYKVYYNRANAKSNLGRHEDALKDYDMSIELNPKYSDLYYNRGHVNYILGNHDDAMKDYDKTIELELQCIEEFLKYPNELFALHQRRMGGIK